MKNWKKVPKFKIVEVGRLDGGYAILLEKRE